MILFLNDTECSLASPGSPCSNLEADDCKYEHIGEHCCCGRCSESHWLTLACVFDPSTGNQHWQPVDTFCSAEDCGSKGKRGRVVVVLVEVGQGSFFTQCPWTTGYITSPNYPGPYPINYDTTEIVKVREGLLILLQFTSFNIEYQSNCLFDFVSFTEGNGTILMDRTCGSTMEANVQIGSQILGSSLPIQRSRSNIVRLRFKSDYSSAMLGNRWSVSWVAVTPG